VDRFGISDDATFDDAEEVRFGHLRAETRDSMLLMATLRRPGRGEVTIKVRNLSAGGLMAECDTNLSRGEVVDIDLRGIGWVAGTIAWMAGGRFGVAFAASIDPKLARKPVSGGPQPQLVRTARTMWRPGLR
jgi:hypothetical protein